MKILFLFLIPLTTFAQIYSFDEGLGQTQSVDAVWLPGTIVTAQGETLEGQVRGFVYNAASVDVREEDSSQPNWLLKSFHH